MSVSMIRMYVYNRTESGRSEPEPIRIFRHARHARNVLGLPHQTLMKHVNKKTTAWNLIFTNTRIHNRGGFQPSGIRLNLYDRFGNIIEECNESRQFGMQRLKTYRAVNIREPAFSYSHIVRRLVGVKLGDIVKMGDHYVAVIKPLNSHTAIAVHPEYTRCVGHRQETHEDKMVSITEVVNDVHRVPATTCIHCKIHLLQDFDAFTKYFIEYYALHYGKPIAPEFITKRLHRRYRESLGSDSYLPSLHKLMGGHGPNFLDKHVFIQGVGPKRKFRSIFHARMYYVGSDVFVNPVADHNNFLNVVKATISHSKVNTTEVCPARLDRGRVNIDTFLSSLTPVQ